MKEEITQKMNLQRIKADTRIINKKKKELQA